MQRASCSTRHRQPPSAGRLSFGPHRECAFAMSFVGQFKQSEKGFVLQSGNFDLGTKICFLELSCLNSWAGSMRVLLPSPGPRAEAAQARGSLTGTRESSSKALTTLT